jgi:rhamnosyltransferase
MLYLIRHGHALDCVRVVYLSACKAIGFSLGKKYYMLPKSLIEKLTMNREYWN